ncbi:hypothetical protein Cci01nite_19510 [Catellatospora citrea]|uniref:Uncharacterized protein n=1 Tax=Catellatospora citrea TaxID=53366 RepID=A0A8J3K5J4_9ACTN|nr:hypothetical protein Cci01nite_19510 [Catellatospora citrea]
MGGREEDVAVPKPHPREFPDDVVRVVQTRDVGVTVEQIAKDFGVHRHLSPIGAADPFLVAPIPVRVVGRVAAL